MTSHTLVELLAIHVANPVYPTCCSVTCWNKASDDFREMHIMRTKNILPYINFYLMKKK